MVSEGGEGVAGGQLPSTFWQNRRRRIITCITTYPPSFRKPLTPLLTMLIFTHYFMRGLYLIDTFLVSIGNDL
jgi:hypothetical protein